MTYLGRDAARYKYTSIIIIIVLIHITTSFTFLSLKLFQKMQNNESRILSSLPVEVDPWNEMTTGQQHQAI